VRSLICERVEAEGAVGRTYGPFSLVV